MSNVTAQTSAAVAIAEAHSAAVAILSATGRDLFEATEIADLLALSEAAATASEAIPGSDEPRAELIRRSGDGHAQIAEAGYISATRAHDIALDCWGPLETLAALLN